MVLFSHAKSQTERQEQSSHRPKRLKMALTLAVSRFLAIFAAENNAPMGLIYGRLLKSEMDKGKWLLLYMSVL